MQSKVRPNDECTASPARGGGRAVVGGGDEHRAEAGGNYEAGVSTRMSPRLLATCMFRVPPSASSL